MGKIDLITYRSKLTVRFALFGLILSLNNTSLDAEGPKHVSALNDSIDDINNQVDVIDILINIKLLPDKKPDTLKNNSLGPYISFIPSVGYEMVSGYTAAVETNISFYNDPGKEKISSILANANYSINKQAWSIINSNIFLNGQKFNLQGDYRIYHFPTQTYGLGGLTLPTNSELIDYKYLRFYQFLLGEITPNMYLGGGYLLDYHWNIKEINIPANELTDFEKYGKTPYSTSSGVSLNFQYNSRANINNPQGGVYFNFQYNNYLKIIKSNRNWQSLIIDARKYLKFPYGSKNILAFWSYNNITLSGNPPYLDLPSIGCDAYSNTGRGYIQGRFRSKNFIDLESEYRFSLTESGLLGAVAYSDVSSFSEWPSNAFKTLNPGTGIGIRIKLNKHSATNFAADYAFGLKGSRGIFFNMGEVF